MLGDGAVLIATYDVELGFHSPGLGALPRRLGVTKRVTDRAKSSPKTVTPVTEVKPSQAAPIRWRVQPRDHQQHDSRCSRTPGGCCGSAKAHGWSTAGRRSGERGRPWSVERRWEGRRGQSLVECGRGRVGCHLACLGRKSTWFRYRGGREKQCLNEAEHGL